MRTWCGELLERRALRNCSGFTTNCLQSEMILPHMPAQPDSLSLRHMVMHLRKSQLASNAWAELTAMKSTVTKTKKQPRRMRRSRS
jgi:hypothetical protein